jgi:GH15 family glucan-1,4-alpha-glucosidase
VPVHFPPIESYGFLSDGEVNALVAPDGSVEWLCLPRPDSPTVFGAILDRGAGSWRFGPAGALEPGSRRYLPGSLTIQTTWQTASGRLVAHDALAMTPDGTAAHMLVRLLRCEEGSAEVEAACEPAFDYGRQRATWQPQGRDGRLTSRAPDGSVELVLATDLATSGRLSAGQTRFAAIAWGGAEPPTDVVAAEHLIDATADHWRRWLAGGRIPEHPWRPILERSALTLKGLIYAPSGAPIAAATTSLPETIGGERNWDYRYTWLRDGVFTMEPLQDLGFPEEGRRFIGFLAGRLDGHPLQIMYRVGGERELPESTLDHLTGYEGSRPVRIGNGAVHQRQHDMWGVVLDLVLRDTEASGQLPAGVWSVVPSLVDEAIAEWRQPDRGVWEVRGEPRHFTSSKVMAWVALDRGARLARHVGDLALADRWASEAALIHADVLARGLDERGVLTQTYGSGELDASILLLPLMGFLPPDDGRVRRTVLAIADELTEDGFVLRYRTETTDDGLSGEEGSFTICSFWLVSALARIGEVARARELFDRLLAHASPLGLYGEELDPVTGRHLGNFPQAFSHLALIGAALDLIRAEAP